MAAIVDEMFGTDSAEARAARAARVDTTALYQGGDKLGLGSSAAATVAALAASVGVDDRPLLHRLADRAHKGAQTAVARGSGADVAACVWGGVAAVHPRGDGVPAITQLALPRALELVFVWTRHPADTRALVAQVRALYGRDRAVWAAATLRLAEAAASLIAACRADDAAAGVAAVAAGADAAAQLGRDAGVELVTDAHRALTPLANARGGAVKPTGAGGGDIAVAAFAVSGSAADFCAQAAGLGMKVLDLCVDPVGATLDIT